MKTNQYVFNSINSRNINDAETIVWINNSLFNQPEFKKYSNALEGIANYGKDNLLVLEFIDDIDNL